MAKSMGKVVQLRPDPAEKVGLALEAQATKDDSGPKLPDSLAWMSRRSDDELFCLIQDRFYGLDKYPILQKFFGQKYAKRREDAYKAVQVMIFRREKALGVGPFKPVALELDRLLAEDEQREKELARLKQEAEKKKIAMVVEQQILKQIEKLKNENSARFQYDLPAIISRAVSEVHYRFFKSGDYYGRLERNPHLISTLFDQLPEAIARQMGLQVTQQEAATAAMVESQIRANKEAILQALSVPPAAVGKIGITSGLA